VVYILRNKYIITNLAMVTKLVAIAHVVLGNIYPVSKLHCLSYFSTGSLPYMIEKCKNIIENNIFSCHKVVSFCCM